MKSPEEMTVEADRDDVDDIDEAGSTEGSRARTLPSQEVLKMRPTAFDKLRRDLSDEELGQTGVQKLLLFQIEELGEKIRDLEPFRTRFHRVDVALAVARSRIQGNTWVSILEAVCLAFGGIFFGMSRSADSEGEIHWDWLMLGGGALLILLAVVARIFSYSTEKLGREGREGGK